jgi:hypothetical protein
MPRPVFAGGWFSQIMSKCPHRAHLLCFVLFLIAFSIRLAAQEKAAGKAEGGTRKLVKVEGTVRCDKPDPSYSNETPDRPGHALMIEQRKCAWGKPLVVLGAKTQAGVMVSFTEKMEGALHLHGYEVDTLDNGEKLTMRNMTQILKEKGPASFRGRWSFMRGTGKFKGIKGGGTFDGKLEEGGTLTLDLEGSYVPEEMAAGKK